MYAKCLCHNYEKELGPQKVRDWINNRGVPSHTMFVSEVIDVIER